MRLKIAPRIFNVPKTMSFSKQDFYVLKKSKISSFKNVLLYQFLKPHKLFYNAKVAPQPEIDCILRSAPCLDNAIIKAIKMHCSHKDIPLLKLINLQTTFYSLFQAFIQEQDFLCANVIKSRCDSKLTFLTASDVENERSFLELSRPL